MRKHVVWVALAQLLPLLAIGDGSNMAWAADECRSGPGGPSPSGSHWYYRIDRATKRKCWYLGPLGQRTARQSIARSSRRAVAAAPVTPPPASNAALRDPDAESFAETTPQPRMVTSSTVAGPRRAPATNRAPIVARDQGDDRSTANEMPLVWPAPASAAPETAVGKTTVAAADPSVEAPAATAAPAPAAAAEDPAARPAPPLAATTVAAKAAPAAVAATAAAAPVPAAAPAPAVAAPVPAATPAAAVPAPTVTTPVPTAPADHSSVSWVKLSFIFAFIASLLALVGFLGRGLIDYVIARRANRRAAERARTEAAWTAGPPPPMPYMHAPHLADDFEPTPERPVQDQHGDWPRVARQSAMRGRVA